MTNKSSEQPSDSAALLRISIFFTALGSIALLAKHLQGTKEQIALILIAAAVLGGGIYFRKLLRPFIKPLIVDMGSMVVGAALGLLGFLGALRLILSDDFELESTALALLLGVLGCIASAGGAIWLNRLAVRFYNKHQK
jgi:hypothetical protein